MTKPESREQTALNHVESLVIDDEESAEQVVNWHVETAYYLYLTDWKVKPEVRVALNSVYQFTGIEVDRIPVELDQPARDKVVRWLNAIDPEKIFEVEIE